MTLVKECRFCGEDNVAVLYKSVMSGLVTCQGCLQD